MLASALWSPGQPPTRRTMAPQISSVAPKLRASDLGKSEEMKKGASESRALLPLMPRWYFPPRKTQQLLVGADSLLLISLDYPLRPGCATEPHVRGQTGGKLTRAVTAGIFPALSLQLLGFIQGTTRLICVWGSAAKSVFFLRVLCSQIKGKQRTWSPIQALSNDSQINVGAILSHV